MTTYPKEIYKTIANAKSIDEDIVESIGRAMFQSLRTKLNTPTSLSYEVPNIGTFIIRFNYIDKFMDYVDRMIKLKDPEILKDIEENPEKYKSLRIILAKIKDYRENKNKFRSEKYDTIKPSENNS